MSRRYFTTPRAWLPADEEWTAYPGDDRRGIDVFETARGQYPTGLVDKRGNQIMAVEYPNPIGFTAKIEE